jgi:hypothetical protein
MELLQKEVIHYNDLVETYRSSDSVTSAASNNSSPTEGNMKLLNLIFLYGPHGGQHISWLLKL